MLITLVLFGKYLESAAKGKTSEALTRLCQLAPPTALVVEPAGGGKGGGGDGVERETEVPTELVHRGDVLKVRVRSQAGALGSRARCVRECLARVSGVCARHMQDTTRPPHALAPPGAARRARAHRRHGARGLLLPRRVHAHRGVGACAQELWR